MRAVELQIKEAKEKGQEWVEQLATLSDKRLVKRLKIVRQQMLIAEQNKDELGFELMLLWEHLTICARMHKQEFNVPDEEEEKIAVEQEEEVVENLQDKRQEIIAETIKIKKQKSMEIKNDDSQLTLF